MTMIQQAATKHDDSDSGRTLMVQLPSLCGGYTRLPTSSIDISKRLLEPLSAKCHDE